MSNYDTLKKIIPPDQALANEAFSRSLRQVKDIFNTDLPTLAQAVGNLESNKDLPLINSLTTPIPQSVQSYWSNTFATGTGPGGTVTTNDLLGTAAGNTHVVEIPVVTSIVSNLSNIGALNSLTANGGTASSAINGVYTVMSYCLAGAYTSSSGTPPTETFTVTIPAPLPGYGSYSGNSAAEAVDSAFVNLIANANSRINSISSTYSDQAQQANEAFNLCADQLSVNIINCEAAGIDIGNVVNDIANANLVANSVTTSLGLVSRLPDIGLAVEENGPAQFFEAIAQTNTLSGQAVIASMREGRNIATLNAVGITLDTQLVDVNPNTTASNVIQQGQYSVAEARGNIVL